MGEPRFNGAFRPLDLDAILAITGATLARAPARPVAIAGVGAIDWAGPHDLAMLDDPVDAAALSLTEAGACLVPPELVATVPAGAASLASEAPRAALARVAEALRGGGLGSEALFGPGVSPGAVIHPDARLEPDVVVGPGAVIGPGAEIGRGAVIGANAVVAGGVRLGRDSAVGAGATLSHALVGDRVRIEAGVRVGDATGGLGLGRVIVQDDAKIGANATIARGSLGDTVIGEGARIGAGCALGPDATVGRFALIQTHSALEEPALPERATAPGAKDMP